MNSIDLAGVGMTSQRTRERLIQRLKDQGITNQRLLDVFRVLLRDISFLDEALAHRAYEDTALPIGFSQTLSQPYIVARMTEILLAAGPLRKVLEIGTGSGFQATILAQLVERCVLGGAHRATADKGERAVPQARPAQYHRRALRWQLSAGSSHAPYDGIITTAAPQAIPDELLHQLAPDWHSGDSGGCWVMCRICVCCAVLAAPPSLMKRLLSRSNLSRCWVA